MKKVFLAIAIVSLIAVFMSSCRTGYGCRGRESWGHMVRRINSQ
jgi:hypothetical protein